MFITPSFKKSLIIEQFQGNYLQFPDQRVKGIMRTSGEIDFRFRLKLKITLLESTYPSQRPECLSLSPHFLLIETTTTCIETTGYPSMINKYLAVYLFYTG